MSDEGKLHDDMGRAARAQALLDDELLSEAFKSIESDYFDYWRNKTALDDVAGRERLWQAAHILGKVRGHLDRAVRNGKLAKEELQRLAQGSQG